MNELLTLDEVADIFRVDASTVRRWIRIGAIKGIALPHRKGKRCVYRVRKSEVQAHLSVTKH